MKLITYISLVIRQWCGFYVIQPDFKTYQQAGALLQSERNKVSLWIQEVLLGIQLVANGS